MNLFRTKTFLKDYKKTKFSDSQYQKYILYIKTLLDEKNLPEESRDHALKGEWSDFREFHIGGDLILIYLKEDTILKLVRIGTHSQLF